MAPYIHAKMARSYGWSIETGTESVSGNQRTQTTGRRPNGNCESASRPGTTRSLISSGKESNYNSADWVDFFLENYSRPPIRAEKTHEANQRVGSASQGGIRPAIDWRDYGG